MSTLNEGETLQPFKPLRNNLIFDSSGNLVGIQNDRANGNDFRIGGGSGVDGTFATLVATTALKINSSGTLDLYNTADQTTNYERLRADWSGNVGRILTQAGGTGVVRGMSLASGTYAGTSGTTTALTVNPEFNQSGTASYTALDINPTETATGSGTKLLQRWAVGGTVRSQVDNNGVWWASIFAAINELCFATSIGVAADTVLRRDAADTLALSRSTNAQTFRVYNTYTDASNGEYLQAAWSGNVAHIRTVAQGTGVSRSLVIGTFGATSLYFQTNTVTRWEVSSSGHFLTIADNTYDIGASGANRPRNVYLGSWMRMATTTVASLPAAATAAAGARMFVTDANATTFASIVAAGGANIVPVYSDGTNWRIG